MTPKQHQIAGLAFASLVSILSISQASAQDDHDDWYQVELIIFENTSPTAVTAEKWPAETGFPDLEDAIELQRDMPDMVDLGELHEPSDVLEADETPLMAEPLSTPTLDPTQPVLMSDFAEPVASPISDVASAGPAFETEQPYQILDPEQHQLNEAFLKLEESNTYRPMLHIAWRQVVPDRSTPDRIRLSSLLQPKTLMEEFAPPNIDTAEAVEFEFEPMAEEPFVGPPAELALLFAAVPEEPSFDGVLSLGKGRYLHVAPDLMFYKPNRADVDMDALAIDDIAPEAVLEEGAVEEPVPELFRIQGNLRMRSSELHYLDHPVVGMIIHFSRYTPPEPEAESVTTETLLKPE